MRVIFEENIEHEDFFEIILSSREYDKLLEKGIVQDFPQGLHGKRNLNVYIRIDKYMEDPECLSKAKPNNDIYTQNILTLLKNLQNIRQSQPIKSSRNMPKRKKPLAKEKQND